MFLDGVRRGFPTDETITTLKQRVIQVSVVDKLNELKEAGQTPVCLFPTRKQCDGLNSEMLKCLPSKVKVIHCTDDIDQTSTSRKWTTKATEHLEKLNHDCNRTAGLEANLHLAGTSIWRGVRGTEFKNEEEASLFFILELRIYIAYKVNKVIRSVDNTVSGN